MINLVQISDPHFGEQFSNSKEHWIARIPLVGGPGKGLNAHDYVLCQALDQCLNEDIRDLAGIDDDDDLVLVMNGDLSATGQAAEFDVANTYLFSHHSVVQEQRLQAVGLDLKIEADDSNPAEAHPADTGPADADAGDLDAGDAATSKLYAGIPGNHDHWSGSSTFPLQRGFSPGIYQYFFATPPFVTRYWIDELELCVFGIDSCSMFSEQLINRSPFANGGFSSEHRESFRRCLETELSRPLASGCRVRTAMIVCHHPFSTDGSAGPLCLRCVHWLCQTAAEFGIRMVFTGHTHRTWTVPVEFENAQGQPGRVREVRCPTTLQTPAKFNSQHRSPGLWLHQISVDADEVVWKGTLLLFAGDSFVIPVQGSLVEGEPEREVWFEERMPSLDRGV